MGMSAASGIKSVQRGTATITNGTLAIAISPVNMAKAFIQCNWVYSGSAGQLRTYLSAANTLTMIGTLNVASYSADWEVTEFY